MRPLVDPTGQETSRRLRTIEPHHHDHPHQAQRVHTHGVHAPDGHAHHLAEGTTRPPRSLLALSGLERLMIATPVIVVLWLLVIWAIR
jgi:hypothetical protein